MALVYVLGLDLTLCQALLESLLKCLYLRLKQRHNLHLVSKQGGCWHASALDPIVRRIQSISLVCKICCLFTLDFRVVNESQLFLPGDSDETLGEDVPFGLCVTLHSLFYLVGEGEPLVLKLLSCQD